MYYLNDKHPKYEYAIYTRVNNATPYIGQVFDNMKQVEVYLESIGKRHNKYHQTFYIDADGYENNYPKEFADCYYKLLIRPVNDWQEIA